MDLDQHTAAVVAADLSKAEKIRRLKQHGLRQADIARALGIRPQFVSNVVKAAQRPATTSARTTAPPPLPADLSTVRTQVGEGGRIVVPAAFRAALGMEVGEQVLLRVEDGELRVFTPQEGIRKAQELLRHYIPEGVSLADELIAERRAEAARE